ncbi:MAG: RIO1 family regulatory kinase/ATPase [Cetobacterium sp.]
MKVIDKVSKIEVSGKTFYLKKNVDKKLYKKKIMAGIQKVIADVFKVKILAPTANTHINTEEEALKIKKLKELGIPVPEVVFSCSSYFIMRECGESLLHYLRNHRGLDPNIYLKKAMGVLSKLHNCGHAHGGAQIRNFTIKNEDVYMIDFEEVINEKYTSYVQVRDIFVFLISLNSLKTNNIKYLEILKEYENYSNLGGEIISKVIFLASKLKFLGYLYEKHLVDFLGKDIQEVSKLVFELNNFNKKLS